MAVVAQKEPVAWGLTASIFVLGLLFSTAAWYLQNVDLVALTIDYIVGVRSLPENFNRQLAESAKDLPLSVFILLIGAVLSFFAGQVLAFTRSAWTSIAASLEDYRDGLHQGILRFQGEAIRLLKYVDSDGILINTTAHDEPNAPRNVLLNNRTIQQILSSIASKSEEDLERVGAACGSGFGAVILRLNDIDKDSLRALMFAWFKYDSNSGFGRFELVEEPGRFHIVLRHNFLASGKEFRTPDSSLCAFMRGYIRGVMSSMPPVALSRAGIDLNKLVVRHDSASEDCICTSHRDNRGCTFTVEAAS